MNKIKEGKENASKVTVNEVKRQAIIKKKEEDVPVPIKLGALAQSVRDANTVKSLKDAVLSILEVLAK